MSCRFWVRRTLARRTGCQFCTSLGQPGSAWAKGRVQAVSDIQLNDPQTLYRRWEESQWSPFAIDLRQDVAQWPTIAAGVRELLLFVLSSLMVAEERITTKFSGLVGAYASEEEATFLATRPGTCSSTPASRTR